MPKGVETAEDAVRRLRALQAPPPTAEQRVRANLVSRFPEFCWRLLTENPDSHFVFFERDALALRWVMEELIDPDNHSRLQTVFLNRAMLPQAIRKLSAETTSIRATFLERQAGIIQYRPQTRHNKAVRFLQQELADTPQGAILIDTGYWGTVPLFAQAALPKKKFKVAWFYGPEGSSAFLTDRIGPEGPVHDVERFFPWTHDAETLESKNGRLVPAVFTFGGPKAELAEREAALRKIAREWKERHSMDSGR